MTRNENFYQSVLGKNYSDFRHKMDQKGPFCAWNLNNFSFSAIVRGSEKQASQSTLLLQKFSNFEKEVLKAFSFEI